MPLFRDKNGDVLKSGSGNLGTSKIINDNHEASDHSPDDSEDPNTKLLMKSSNQPVDPIITDDAMSNPVVGWLVIVDGPGKGRALKLGYGMNSIGQSPQERICLNFGDKEVSRNQHAVVSYEPRERKSYVEHGGGQILTYLDDEPLLVPVELHGGEDILVGQTTLRFVPFCGEKFDWQDNS